MLGKRAFPLECASTSLQGGRRSGLLEHVRPRHGLGNLQRAGWAQAEDRGGWSDIDGAVLEVARRRKEATYPELSGENGRARLVVLAAEVGRRWNNETAQFVAALANARAQEVPLVLQGRAQAAWVRRWSAILACTGCRCWIVAPGGTGEAIPSVHEVMREARFQ